MSEVSAAIDVDRSRDSSNAFLLIVVPAACSRIPDAAAVRLEQASFTWTRAARESWHNAADRGSNGGYARAPTRWRRRSASPGAGRRRARRVTARGTRRPAGRRRRRRAAAQQRHDARRHGSPGCVHDGRRFGGRGGGERVGDRRTRPRISTTSRTARRTSRTRRQAATAGSGRRRDAPPGCSGADPRRVMRRPSRAEADDGDAAAPSPARAARGGRQPFEIAPSFFTPPKLTAAENRGAREE